MLEAVLDHAQKQGWTSEPGFSRKNVRWAIHVAVDGTFVGFTSLGDGKDGINLDRCPHLTQGQMVSGGETRSQFLIESLQTVLQHCKDDITDGDREKMQRKQTYFQRLLTDAAEAAPELQGAARFMADESQRSLALDKVRSSSPRPKPTDSVTFFMEGMLAPQTTGWHPGWQRFVAGLVAQSVKAPKQRSGKTGTVPEADAMRCVLTADLIKPAKTHGAKIRGLAGVGGLGTGDVMAGFDKAAFQSYGLDDSRNAATSDEMATAYAEALSRLIAENSVKIGDAIAVYWFSNELPKEDDPIALALAASAVVGASGDGGHAARRVLESAKKGTPEGALANEYHLLILSGAAGRVMVRHYAVGRLEELADAVCGWFEDLAIVHRDGGMLAPAPKFMAVVGGLFRELKEAPARFIVPLWLSAIHQHRIPREAMSKALLRIRIDIVNDTSANHARMGLLKAFHIRNLGDQHMKPYLNPEHPSPAYHCGRMLAVMSRLQRSALGDVGAGVVQRNYGAMSQAPALHLGRLVSNAKNHLQKLDAGLAFWFEEQIADIAVCIGDAAPRALTLEQQSLFALGYYQQLAHSRQRKADKPGMTPDTTSNERPEG